MNDEARLWLRYADENRRTARLTRDGLLLNPCLQNCQQAVEKLLKAVLIHLGHSVRRTHSIRELVQRICESGASVPLSEDECDLLDSVYLPSKYPLGSALPLFEPDEHLCDRCLAIVDELTTHVEGFLQGTR